MYKSYFKSCLECIIRPWILAFKGIFKDKSKYPTLTRMSYCQCRLRLVFSSIFKEFGWSHVALILDRSDLFSWTVGKNLEYGLRKEGLLKFVRELDGNSEDESYHYYLRDASMYARGKRHIYIWISFKLTFLTKLTRHSFSDSADP